MNSFQSENSYSDIWACISRDQRWIIQDKKMRAARGEELQLLELSSWLSQGQGARERTMSVPSSLPCHPAATPHRVCADTAYLCLMSESAKKGKEGKQTGRNKKRSSSSSSQAPGHIRVHAEEFILVNSFILVHLL